MKAVKKIAIYVVSGFVGLVVVLVVAFYLFGEGAIKSAVETAASKALGVAVTVEDVDLSILRGRVGIEGLVVKNPSGYANENLLELGEGLVAVNIGSLLGDTVKIREIKLDGAKLTMEQKGLTNNLKEIIDRLPKGSEADEQPAGKKLHIDKLEITNTNVKVKLLPVPGKSDTVSMKIGPIVMEDLGSDNKLSVGVLTAKIFSAMATGVAKQGVGVLPDDMVKGIGSGLGTTIDLGTAATKEGQKLLETTTDAGKDVLGGLKDLLGGKKKE